MNLPQGPYKPQETEPRILKQWLESGVYKPEYAAKLGATETFSIIMPPPNANGDLHLGHTLGYANQDLMGRYQRMKGKKVLLLPGKDHAGIQTEVVFEKLLKEKGIDKKELGREEFYRQSYEFCIENSANARRQEQRMGVSADFERELFTLDPLVVDEVINTFLLLHEDELVYRGKRLINWCPRCQSALADIDTEYKDSKSPFFYFKYAFTEPEADAVAIKNKYSPLDSIEWIYERSTSSTGEELPFEMGKPTDSFELETGELGVIGIGGFSGLKPGDKVSGIPVGILMRLDKKFRLIVSNPETQDNLDGQLKELFLFEIGKAAGAHIIRFDEYSDDKFYTNGFVLATVRPETKFGDTAIAADPKDERYSEFVGNQFEVQTLLGTAKLNFIADSAVDAEFGTGIVKVTPAHSPEDWDIASRHPEESFPEKQVIDFDGKLNHLTGKYEGLTVNQARRQLAEDMEETGMLVHLDEEYENRVQICERCKSRIEPLISYQWFLDTTPLKAEAKKLVDDGITEIMPEGKKNVYLQWMDSPEDWCITRQLWWGYRIPVWYKGEKSQYITETGEVKEKIGDRIIESKSDYDGIMKVQVESPGEGWIQDPDVLDTWFSSGQWPYVTLKAREGDFEQFYPSQVMETAWDILIFWVTRMMMLSTYRAKKDGLELPEKYAPFANVYLHGLVLDKDGQKMSKSKGNGIDPTETIEKYGADALRMTYFVGNPVGQNLRLYEEKVSSFGRFLNKIWNASKFVMMNLEGVDPETALQIDIDSLELESNKELINHIANLKTDITRLMDTFQFGVASQLLYNEFWHSFADIHIEAAKPHVYTQKDRETGEIISEPEASEKSETQAVLLFALQSYIKMLHPFAPFITEELWSFIPKAETQSDVLMYERW